MLALPLRPPPGASTLTVLAVGAHPDDLEIGCGATMAALAATSEFDVRMHWLVLSGTPGRALEARAAAQDLLGPTAASIDVAEFPDGYFPSHVAQIKGLLTETVSRTRPDLVLCPGQADAHQDHRTVGELMWQTARQATILEYEIPKWESDLLAPTLFVQVSEAALHRKLDVLHRHFPSQHDKPWFDDEVFTGLMRLRGVQCGCRYAEAFHARKTLLRF